MSKIPESAMEQLQSIMTSLLEHQLAESLQGLHGSLGKWQQGEAGVFDTHAEVLRHAARAESLASKMAQVGLENAESLLRDAFDCELISRDEFVELVGKEPNAVSPSPPVSADSSENKASKREVVEELLATGPVLVHVDARHAEASVPPQFAGDAKLVLRFGYGLTPAIIDLCIDEESLGGTLTFGGIPQRCTLGWKAVYAVVSETDQKGMIWPEDVPSGVLDSLRDEGDEAATAGFPPPDVAARDAKRGSHLKLVK